MTLQQTHEFVYGGAAGDCAVVMRCNSTISNSLLVLLIQSLSPQIAASDQALDKYTAADKQTRLSKGSEAAHGITVLLGVTMPPSGPASSSMD